MSQHLLTRSINSRLVVYLLLCTEKYDTYTNHFLDVHHHGVVVNIGCGMDTRFFLVDNSTTHFFDHALPRMIEFRQKLRSERE